MNKRWGNASQHRPIFFEKNPELKNSRIYNTMKNTAQI
jgi:hypothetical protein